MGEIKEWEHVALGWVGKDQDVGEPGTSIAGARRHGGGRGVLGV